MASSDAFSTARGYGFEPGAPHVFSVALRPGNYRVRATLGDARRASDTSIKAEARRVMLVGAQVAAGLASEQEFVVNVRDAALRSGQEVRLKAREVGSRSWDGKLTLEFCGPSPAVRALEIQRDDAVPTLFIAGDSTVCDQAEEPWAGWGQMMPLFFGASIAVANHAESGESLRSFQSERRLEKVAEEMRPGDFLLVQFGHNDQKERGEGIGAFTSYKTSLKYFVQAARERGATPILVTSMARRRFDEAGRLIETLGDFPEAVRQAAREEGAALIDLHASSRAMYEAWGPEGSKRAFVHYAAGTFPGQSEPLKDDTHFNAYGAFELARCIAQRLREGSTALKNLLREALAFDPAHPDPEDAVRIPPSLPTRIARPEGS